MFARLFAHANTQRGIALVAVLWGLMLMAIIAASITKDTRSHLRISSNIMDNARAEAAADAGFAKAVMGLHTSVGDGGLRVDGTVYKWQFDDSTVLITIYDEGGKIDLNTAAPDLLVRFFEVLGVDNERATVLADRIADFRDPDDLVRPNGAEEADYQRSGREVGPNNGPFRTQEELQLVLGVTPEIYEMTRSDLTIYSGRASPDANLASTIVRAAMNVASRESPREPAYLTEDANLGGEIGPTGNQSASSNGDDDLQIVQQGHSLARSKAMAYRVHIEAKTSAGSVFIRDAVVRIPGNNEKPYSLLLWKRGERQLWGKLAP